MNASMCSEVAIETDQARYLSGEQVLDIVPEGVSFHEPIQASKTVRTYSLDKGIFETFIGGEGI
jgi:hypothetical protein